MRKRGKFVAARLSSIERKRLEALARKWGTPMSDILRWALRMALSEDAAKKETPPEKAGKL